MNYIRYINRPNPYPNIKRGVGKGKESVGEGEERVVEGGICAIGYRGMDAPTDGGTPLRSGL